MRPSAPSRPRSSSAPSIRLATLRDGFRSVTPAGDLDRLAETGIAKIADSVGVDLARPTNPFVTAVRSEDRVFYVFYKHCENAFADRPYVIQRIKKTERTWKTPGSEPTERITYQVEVFKILGGASKRLDQHHGRYGLQGNHRRQILKEYELGFGEVADKCEGRDWPFEASRLFELVQKYQEQPGHFDETHLVKPMRWSLAVDFDAAGDWTVSSPELDLDVPASAPKIDADQADRIAKSTKVRLVPGRLLGPFRSIAKSVGREVERIEFKNGRASVTTEKGLRFSLNERGVSYRVVTIAGFEGSIEAGVRHGMSRVEVAKQIGLPNGQEYRAWTWSYPGFELRFDGLDRVDRIAVVGEK